LGAGVSTGSKVNGQFSGKLLDPLVLRIDQQSRWFLNEKPILPESLPGALGEALSQRDDWFVYLDADPTLSFDDDCFFLRPLSANSCLKLLARMTHRVSEDLDRKNSH
jgi:biopolymer transport protein ExbD